MILEIGNIPQIDIIINDESFEIIFEKNKSENIFLFKELDKVKLLKGKKFFLYSLLLWMIEIVSNIDVGGGIYRKTDVFQILKKDDKVIKKELITEKINFTNLDLAIRMINKNIKRKRKTMPNII